MKKSLVMGLAIALTTAGLSSIALADNGGIKSLRGDLDAEETSKSASNKQWHSDQDPIARDYVQQPPLIPHKTKGYKINTKFNKCMTCHSWSNYKEAGATKISLTHFETRAGDALSNVSPRRYFCTQCHVQQVDAKPLIENTFAPVKSLNGDK